MIRKLFVAGAFLLCLAFAGVAAAQVPATLLLKSGERVSGNLVDMSGRGFTVDVSGQSRQIPASDVSVIDFTGGAQNLPANEVARLQGQNLLVLKNGQALNGKLTDIGGRNPLRITFSAANGQQQNYSSSDIGRIYLSAPAATSASTPPAPTPVPTSGNARTVQVSARTQWTSTGVTVRAGQMLTINATGEVSLSGTANDRVSVAGVPGQMIGSFPRGALIGRVGNSAPFLIGNQTTVTAPASGRLLLGVNDDVVTDNNGEYSVTITTQGATRRR